jgi:hypothetical protein
MNMGIYEKLTLIQNELKAPKNQYNSFGKYNYRSCEDILEGLKPVLKKYKAALYITDSIEVIGNRTYVKAVATLADSEIEGASISNTAYARESDTKKGMDDSQVTGATSSYARKYALNGLFLIDDTKDADTDEYQNQQNKPYKKNTKPEKSEEQLNQEMAESVDKDLVPHGEGMTAQRVKRVMSELERTGVSVETILDTYKVHDLKELSEEQYISCINRLMKSKDKA